MPPKPIGYLLGARGFPGGSVIKNPPANAGGPGGADSIPGLGRYPGGGNATHSRILAWRILRTEEPRRLQSKVLQRVRHDRVHMHTRAGYQLFDGDYFIQSLE